MSVKNHRQATSHSLTVLIPFPGFVPPLFCHRYALLPFSNMEELLKHLTEVSIRQQQIVEHLATRQGQTEQELAALHATATPRVPQPDARAQATKLIPKMTPHDDVEAFLQVFENTATMEGWPQGDWAWALAPLLTGEAQRAYFALPAATAVLNSATTTGRPSHGNSIPAIGSWS